MAIRIIQMLLGHSSIRSTEIYTHLTTPLRDQLRQLLFQTTDGLFEGKGAQPWLIPKFARRRPMSNWRILVRRFRPPVRLAVWPGDDALAEEGTFGHCRLLHSRAGRTALPLRRLP